MAASLVAAAAATADNDKKDGFKTAAPPMLIGVAPGSTTEAIISTGDMVGGYRFESIPDGIALQRHDNNRVEAYVNHETSLVPFPFPRCRPTPTTEANAQNDFENAQVSLLTLNRATAGVLDGRLVVTSAENYQRFCSSFLATKAAGFNRPILLTNEEGIDWVKRSGKPWPTTVGAADSRQIGVVVAVDARTGKSNPIWGMGRHNHENSLAVPGYGHPVVLSGDDSFVNNPAQSQVYSYIADSANDVMNDRGELYAFVSDVPGKDDYFDFAPGDPTSIHGHFELVPKDIATGRRPDGTRPDVRPTRAIRRRSRPLARAGSATRSPACRSTGRSGCSSTGATNTPRTSRRSSSCASRTWRTTGARACRTSSTSSTRAAEPQGPRSREGRRTGASGRWCSTRTTRRRSSRCRSSSKVTMQPVKTPTEIHQPDNIESTPQGLLITEDPGSSQQFTPTEAGRDDRAAHALHVRDRRVLDIAARVDQSLDENTGAPGVPSDKDATPVPGCSAPGSRAA